MEANITLIKGDGIGPDILTDFLLNISPKLG